MRQIPRLFVDPPLSSGSEVRLEGGQAHYLAHVLRLAAGASVLLCDDSTGEWAAEVAAVAKRAVTLRVGERLRPREAVADVWLCAAPIKGHRWEWIAEKACELGAARLVPLSTERTVVQRVNLERLRAHMVEAAEQCGRTALPVLGEPTPLPLLLNGWSPGRSLVFCDEEGGEPAPFALPRAPAPAAILIGPEGGFSAAERTAIRSVPGAVAITLGPRILRADTAAAVALGLWQALAGDAGG